MVSQELGIVGADIAVVMDLRRRGNEMRRFVVKKGPEDWWDVIDTSIHDEDRLALAYEGKDAKANAVEAAKLMNDFIQEESNDENRI